MGKPKQVPWLGAGADGGLRADPPSWPQAQRQYRGARAGPGPAKGRSAHGALRPQGLIAVAARKKRAWVKS